MLPDPLRIRAEASGERLRRPPPEERGPERPGEASSRPSCRLCLIARSCGRFPECDGAEVAVSTIEPLTPKNEKREGASPCLSVPKMLV